MSLKEMVNQFVGDLESAKPGGTVKILSGEWDYRFYSDAAVIMAIIRAAERGVKFKVSVGPVVLTEDKKTSLVIQPLGSAEKIAINNWLKSISDLGMIQISSNGDRIKIDGFYTTVTSIKSMIGEMIRLADRIPEKDTESKG